MKYLISLLLSCLLFFSVSTAVLAQTSLPLTSPESTVSQGLEVNSLKMEYTLFSLLHTITCITFETPVLNKPCFSFAPLGSLQPHQPSTSTGGVLGFVNGILIALYSNPPIHTQHYIADVATSFSIVPAAQAQDIGGAGSQVIKGVYILWQVSRNFAYVIMSIIFVVIGFMVMFRHRINPQTVITLQAALPGLVVGLILITLSYFFASLLVDIGFIAVYLVGFYFMQTQVGGDNPTSDLIGKNVFQIFSYFTNATNNVNFAPSLEPIFNTITGQAAITLNTLIALIACEYGESTGSVGSAIPFFTTVTCIGAAAKAVGDKAGTIGLIVWVILLLILLYTMLQIIRKLLTNYITILFLAFTAPFHFLVASLPGQGGVATAWVRNMLCNVLAFPGIFAVLYFSAFVLANGNPTIATDFKIKNGMQSVKDALPFLSNLDMDLIRYLIGFGALMAAPSIPDIICDAIGKVGRGGQLIAREIETETGKGQEYFARGLKGFGAGGRTIGAGFGNLKKMTGSP